MFKCGDSGLCANAEIPLPIPIVVTIVLVVVVVIVVVRSFEDESDNDNERCHDICRSERGLPPSSRIPRLTVSRRWTLTIRGKAGSSITADRGESPHFSRGKHPQT
jgi:hypothetical protein